MSFEATAEVEINGREFDVKEATIEISKQVDDANQMLQEWQEENDELYLYDDEFRGKYFKQLAEAMLVPKDGDMPDKEFWEDPKLQYGRLLNVMDFLQVGGRKMLA